MAYTEGGPVVGDWAEFMGEEIERAHQIYVAVTETTKWVTRALRSSGVIQAGD